MLELPVQAADHDVGILVEHIEIDERSATKLLRSLGGKSDAAALREALRVKVEAGEAKVSATSYVRTKSGQRAKIQSTHEFIYPTEFDPPNLPQQLSGPIAPGVDITTHSNPTAYEMRPVGGTLEVDPVVNEGGKTIEINIAPELVEFVGYSKYGKDETEVKQPIFYTMKASTSLTVASGSYVLLGVYTPRSTEGGAMIGDKSRRVLALMRASVVATIGGEDGAEPAGDAAE